MKYKLSIVIPVFNNYHFTKKCLEDLSHLPNDHEIIIVDNGSTDLTRKIQSDEARLKIIRNNINYGFAKAVNIGFTESSGEYVMFLNNDIRVRSNKKEWTKVLLEEAATGAIVGPTVGMLDNNFNFITETNKMPTRGHVYMSGWNITASIDVWNKLILPEYCGPFTEQFNTYFEDVDLSFRAKELNIPIKIAPCPVHHFGKATSKKIGLLEMYSSAKEKFIEKWKDRL